MLLRFLFLLTLLSQLSLLSAQTKKYVNAYPRPGDNVESFLDYYQLNSSCSQQYFFKVNQLKATDKIIAGKSYKLPMYQYKYNGKSIRTTVGIDDFQQALHIQKYNEAMLKTERHKVDFRKTKILWVPYRILNCADEITDPTSVNTPPLKDSYSIFGSKYAKVKRESNALKGKVYYIVAGHGGPDPGAIGKSGGYSLCEDEYAYDISLRLTRYLIMQGATAYMIIRDNNDGIREGKFLRCDKDETCWKGKKIPLNQKTRLTQRSDVINELYEGHRKAGVADQRLVVIHVDSDNKDVRTDMYFYHKENNDSSLNFVNNIHRTIKAKYAKYQKGRNYTGTVSARDLHMLRETKPTAAFIELGNIRNAYDQKRLIIYQNRDAIAKWLSDAMLAEFKK